jgi:hypothetical protein
LKTFFQILSEAFQEKPVTYSSLTRTPDEDEMDFGSHKHQYFTSLITPKSLPANIKQSIREYTNSSVNLNSSIWCNKLSGHPVLNKISEKTDDVRNILKGISTYNKPLPEDMKVYSGLRASSSPPSNSISHIHSFTSTSLDPTVAWSFASPQPDINKQVHHIIELSLPQGSKHGIYVRDSSVHPEEEEYLLGPNKMLHFHSPHKVLKTEDGNEVWIHPARIIEEHEFDNHNIHPHALDSYNRSKSELNDIHDLPSEHERVTDASNTTNNDTIIRHLSDSNIKVKTAALNNPYLSSESIKRAVLAPDAARGVLNHIFQNRPVELSDDEITHFINHSHFPTTINNYKGTLLPHHYEALYNRIEKNKDDMFGLSSIKNLPRETALKIMQNYPQQTHYVLSNPTLKLHESDVEDIIDKNKHRYDFESTFYRLASHHPLSKRAIDMADDTFKKNVESDQLHHYMFESILGNNERTTMANKRYFVKKAIDSLPEESKQYHVNSILTRAHNMGIVI